MGRPKFLGGGGGVGESTESQKRSLRAERMKRRDKSLETGQKENQLNQGADGCDIDCGHCTGTSAPWLKGVSLWHSTFLAGHIPGELHS